MSHGLKTWQKATALVPLALLSGAWTASLAGTSTASADTGDGARLPDGTSIPAEAVKTPASVSAPGVIAPGVPAGAADSVIASASTNGIPAAALAAYQRAAQVINAADPGCHIDWTLIAAIGRVESDHGRYGGNTLTDKGVSSPGIYGIPLDGSNGTAKISDTDAGAIDDDPVVDRAVGPMQFIPSTWSVVGVDGDGDGVRNPQDIDDAALATAVYLCSGNEDLSTAAGQQAAVYRYNHSQKYVDLVLSIMRAYSTGDYSAVPNGSAAPATFTPYFGDSVVSAGTRGFKPFKSKAGGRRQEGRRPREVRRRLRLRRLDQLGLGLDRRHRHHRPGHHRPGHAHRQRPDRDGQEDRRRHGQEGHRAGQAGARDHEPGHRPCAPRRSRASTAPRRRKRSTTA